MSSTCKHLQKALAQMNVQLDNMKCDFVGRPGNGSCARS